MSYTPQPGTIAAKVIEYLRTQPPGTVIASAPLLEAIGHSDISAGLKPFVERAVAEGLIQIEKRPGDRLAYWRLGDGVPLAQPADDDDQVDQPQTVVKIARKRRPAIQPDGARQDAAQDWANSRPHGPEVPTIEEIRRFGLGFGIGVAVRMAERALTASDSEAKALLVDACIALGRAAFTVELPAGKPDA